MWQCIAYVEPDYGPVLYEGVRPAIVIITNAGPATIEVKAWDDMQPDPKAKVPVKLQLRSGNQRMVSGKLVRASIKSA